MKIGFATNDWSLSMRDPFNRPVMGGSGHIRIGQYLKEFNKRGVDFCVGVLTFNRSNEVFGIRTWDGIDFFDCDVIVMQRYMHKKVFDDMHKAQSSGQVIINDVDDWYWGLSEKNAAYNLVDPSINKDENIEWYEKILRKSDGVITSTPFLYSKMNEWNSHVSLHTNFVERYLYTTRKEHSNNKPNSIVVGWMGSTAHRSGDLEILRPYANEISRFATWHHTGAVIAPNVPKFHNEIKVSAGLVTTLPFLPPYDLKNGFKFDAGVVPLSNVPFNHAKSYIKGLEYACAGVPFVASWSPEYEVLVEEHGIGFLAEHPKKFVKLLKNLVDVDYRQSVADDIRKKVKQFDVSVGAPILLKTISDMFNRAKR